MPRYDTIGFVRLEEQVARSLPSSPARKLTAAQLEQCRAAGRNSARWRARRWNGTLV